MKEKNAFLLISTYRGAIMGFAALWIFFFHEWITLAPSDSVLAFPEAFLKRIGFCGVDIFLLLSGIGLTYAIEKTSLGRFYYNRFKRLVIPVLIVAIIRAILESWSGETFWRNLLGINFYTKSMYSFLWFGTAIATFYLIFPLYYKIFKGASNKTVFTAVIILFWLIWSIHNRNTDRIDLFGFTNRIPVFLVGILFGWITQNKKELRFDGVAWCFVWITFILGIYLAYLSNYEGMFILVQVSNCCVPNLLISASLPLLLAKLFAILSETRFLLYVGAPITHVFRFFGLFTLEFYCFQEWFTRLVRQDLGAGWGAATVNLIVFVAVTVSAFAVYLLQIPIWRLVDKLLMKMGILKAPFKITVTEKSGERKEVTL